MNEWACYIKWLESHGRWFLIFPRKQKIANLDSPTPFLLGPLLYACAIVKYPFWKKLQNLEGGGGFCVLLSSSTLKIPFIYPSSLIVSFDMQPSNVLQIRQVVDTNEFTTKVKIVEKVIEVFKHRQPWLLVSACICKCWGLISSILFLSGT